MNPDTADAFNEMDTESLAAQAALRICPAVGGLAVVEYAPANSTLAAVGAFAFLAGLMLSGGYVGATLGRLVLWWKTRGYQP